MIVKEFKIGNTLIKIDDSYVTDNPEQIIRRLEAIVSAALREQAQRKEKYINNGK